MWSRECPRQDSNLYAVSGTGPSNQPVYQFQHVGDPLETTTGRIRRSVEPAGLSSESEKKNEVLGEGFEPSRGCPHRILNPARLPIPPPEPEAIRATCRGTLGSEQAHFNGAEGIRTPDLLNAIQALSQLSYSPNTETPTHVFNQPSSGADGTRTRGLRCDRPAL